MTSSRWLSSATSTASLVRTPTFSTCDLSVECAGRTARRLPYLALCRGEQRSLPDFIHSLARLLFTVCLCLNLTVCRSAEKVAEEGVDLVLSHNTA